VTGALTAVRARRPLGSPLHPRDGALTLEDLLERVAAHIPHHVRFIEEKRRALA
jgi:hypothetical protein